MHGDTPPKSKSEHQATGQRREQAPPLIHLMVPIKIDNIRHLL